MMTSLLLATTSTTALAGGILTNTNQNVAFLRNPARDAAIGIDGVYTNPAGVAFLEDGLHLSINWQNAHQTRTIRSAYGPLFSLNANKPAAIDANGLATREFEGVADAPVLPSLQAAYNLNDKWSFQFGFAISGGGGKCDFEDGLGSFEAVVGQRVYGLANTLVAPNAMATGRYAFDSQLKGRQYYFGFTLGAAYKLTENLSVYGGLRMLYARYEAGLQNIQMEVQPVVETTSKTDGTAYTPVPGTTPQLTTAMADINLDCKQNGLGVAPILGIDYKIGKLNLAAKYDFKVRMRLKNDNDDPNFATLVAQMPVLGKYTDGEKVDEDSPALLTIGAQYEITNKWRVMAGYHHFFDRDTKQWNSSMLGDTNEFNLGTEYDITDRLQVSGGFQKTNYDFEDSFMNDMSFNVSSWTFGLGVGFNITETVKVNAAYFQTNYDTMDVTTQPVPGVTAKNSYTRTNRVFGLGCDITL